MLGHTHTLTGIAGWLMAGPAVMGATSAVAELLPGTATLPPPNPVGFAASVLVCGGAAMLPDIDHEDAVIAHTFWPVGPPLARLISQASGGHREATHSLLFVPFAALLTLATLWSSITAAATVGVFVGLAFAGFASGSFRTPDRPKIREFGRPRVVQSYDSGGFPKLLDRIHPRRQVRGFALPVTLVAAGCTWALVDRGLLTVGELWWLPMAVGFGTLLHTGGDWLTRYGVPWLWPAKREWRRGRLRSRRYAADLFTTNSETERVWITLGLTVLVIGLVAWRAGLLPM